MQKGKNTTAWGRRSRGSHHSVGQQLAGGSHWLTASHPFRRKSGMDGARSHCMEQTLAGLAPLRGAAARGRLALAYCFPPIPQKSGMDGARSFMRCEMEIGGGADEFW